MVQAMNTDNFARSTGRSWDAWVRFLDARGSRNLSHKEIAEAIFATGDASGWWAQTVAVAYEQHIGRRVPGQDGQGEFRTQVSRTVTASLDSVLEAWQGRMDQKSEISAIPVSRSPEATISKKWRYWRCGLSDGTRIVVTIGAKPGGRANIAVSHEKLESVDQIEHWRAFWKAELDSFTTSLKRS